MLACRAMSRLARQRCQQLRAREVFVGESDRLGLDCLQRTGHVVERRGRRDDLAWSGLDDRSDIEVACVHLQRVLGQEGEWLRQEARRDDDDDDAPHQQQGQKEQSIDEGILGLLGLHRGALTEILRRGGDQVVEIAQIGETRTHGTPGERHVAGEGRRKIVKGNVEPTVDGFGELLVPRVGLDGFPCALGRWREMTRELVGRGVKLAGSLDQLLLGVGRPDSFEHIDSALDLVATSKEGLVRLVESPGVNLEGARGTPGCDVALQAIEIPVPKRVDVVGHLGEGPVDLGRTSPIVSGSSE